MTFNLIKLVNKKAVLGLMGAVAFSALTVGQSFADPIDANSGENFVMHLLQQLQDEKLIPTPEFEKHLKKVYELDEKEKF